MKKNLGRTLILLLISVNLFATLTLSVDKPIITLGDELSITISANSSNTVLPALESIANFDVINISSSSSTSIVNSNINHIKSRTYTIKPTTNFTIPALKVMVNGDAEFTLPKDIKVLKTAPKSSHNSKFILELKSDKTDVRVGESFNVVVSFKRRVDTDIQKIALDELKHEAFWIKKVGSDQRDIEGEYEVYKREYMLFAQKEGNFSVGNLIGKVGVLKQQKSNYNDPFFDSFFQRMVFENVHSNKFVIAVSPLPNNLEVYGDFTIKASVDKKIAQANKPINLLIKIQGEGNIEDIKKLNIKIPDTTIFSDTPETKLFIRDGKPYGEFSQKIAIISDANFTIPPISFSYFSSKEQKEVTKKTKPFEIEIKGSSLKQEIKIEKSTKVESKITVDNSTKYIYFILGLLLGVILSLIAYLIKTKQPKKDETPLVTKIKKAKSDKELYNLLLPLAKDDKIKPILSELENNIYIKNSSKKVKKKNILDILKD